MSKLVLTMLGKAWLKYTDLARDYSFPVKYQGYDNKAYDGEGAYEPSAEGFFIWLADGMPLTEPEWREQS